VFFIAFDEIYSPSISNQTMRVGTSLDVENITIARNYLDYLAEEWRLTNVEDWIPITYSQVSSHSQFGRRLLDYHDGSTIKTFNWVYPDTSWPSWQHPWEMYNWSEIYNGRIGYIIPDGFWSSDHNITAYMEWISEQLMISSSDDWYQLEEVDIIERGGSALLSKFRNSPSQLLSKLYPDTDWKLWKFNRCHSLADIDIQKRYLDWIGEEYFGIYDLHNWYYISIQEFKFADTYKLLKTFYNGSFLSMLNSIYTQYDWLPWMFSNISISWDDIDKCMENNTKYKRIYADWLAEQLQISSCDDWYDSIHSQSYWKHIPIRIG
jgi:hypothetical protein